MQNKLGSIIFIGIIFHLIYLYSIIHTYFTSPLVHGMEHYEPPEGKAHRLVFIVGDGLRADSFYKINQQGESVTPFLRSMLEKGSWGISHTRVPTESRPGHVAMLAGFYEDVSAVLTGWKVNPVEFDSVFNQSSFVLQIGSPDVVRMFTSKRGHIETHYYPPEMEDFSTDSTLLDKWVFDKFDEVLKQEKEELRKKGVVIFLHFLGMDSAGHAYKPNTPGYDNGLSYLDRGVEKVVRKIEEFYGDNKTAFIFTADHGMTSRGSHGDGDPECTRTPLLAWGAGIKKYNEGAGQVIYDGSIEYEAEKELMKSQWGLDIKYRKDIRQADMCPLMASLIGIPYPVNNVGMLPISYLDGTEEEQALHMFTNAKQILANYKRKAKLKKEMTRINFQEYESLKDSDRYITEIDRLIMESKFEEAIKSCQNLIRECLNGLHYFQRYDWVFLLTTVTLGYISWIAFVLTYALKYYTTTKVTPLSEKSKTAINIATMIVFILITAYLLMQSAPFMYHIYVWFPIYFFNQVLSDFGVISAFISSQSKLKFIAQVLFHILALEVMMIGYIYREVYSACFYFVGLVAVFSKSFHSKLGWAIACVFISIFTMIQTQHSDTLLVCAGGIFLLCLHSWRLKTSKKHFIHYVQLILLAASIIIVATTNPTGGGNSTLLTISHSLAWLITGVSLVLPLCSPVKFDVRLESMMLGFAAPVVLLSVYHEALFYASLDIILWLWLNHERSQRSIPKKPDTERFIEGIDANTALFFILFINVAFFGMGNLATLGSFDLTSVYRFVTVFNPYLMAAILFLKLLIPLLTVTAFFSVIMKITKTPQFGVFFLVMGFSDCMTMAIFFLVKDTGSWLEIGNSISRFAILNGLIIVLLILIALAQLYTRNVSVKSKKE